MASPLPADERRHAPGTERGWEESWDFDFVTGDGELGGFVRLALRPQERRAWYWAYLAGRNRDLVVVRDHEVELPKGSALEIRGTGLWAQLTCETPLEHWSMGLEASGVAIDDPTECWRGEWGQPVPLGLDLEWEATASAAPSGGSGYGQPSAVHGEVLLGSAVLEVDGVGWRGHTWGTTPWGDGWWRMTAHLDDGTALRATSGGPAGMYPAGGGDPVTVDATATAAFGPDHLPEAATLTVGGQTLAVAPVAQAPVPVDDAAAGLRLVRALCSFSGTGRAGWGWCEWVSGGG